MNLARWKLLQNTAISLLVVYLSAEAGADPTAALAVLALINGISFADLASVWGVSVEVRGDGPTVTLDREKKKKNRADDTEPDVETETDRR